MEAFVVRHAKAGSRRRFEGDDTLRPLSRNGLRQAEGIAELLAHRGIARILTSPFTRCVQTVEPLASRLGLTLEIDDELGEGHRWDHALEIIEGAPEPVALCSHGDVIGDLMHHLAARGVPLDDDRIEKGSTWVLQVEEGEIVKARYLPPPS
ncbi:MAG TPA: phosphoglycerate mutase family protein [Acidimicrobiia bacterium]|jgi:8-oxo-dGTP diphosphatase